MESNSSIQFRLIQGHSVIENCFQDLTFHLLDKFMNDKGPRNVYGINKNCYE